MAIKDAAMNIMYETFQVLYIIMIKICREKFPIILLDKRYCPLRPIIFNELVNELFYIGE